MRTRVGALLAAIVLGATLLAACAMGGGPGGRAGCDDALANTDLASADTAAYGGPLTTACADHPSDDDWFSLDGIQGTHQQVSCNDHDAGEDDASLTVFADNVEVLSAVSCDAAATDLDFTNAIAASIVVVVNHHDVGSRVDFSVSVI